MKTAQLLRLSPESARCGWRSLSPHLHSKKWIAGILVASLACGLSDKAEELRGAKESAEAALARGDGYLAIREYDRAIIEYTRAIELKPDFADAYNNRAYAAYSKYDGTGDPLGDLTRALALRPDFAHAYNTRGCVYMATGDPDKAIADFNRAVQLQPDYPRAYRNRANAYLRKGRISLAMADFERAGGNPKRVILYVSVGLSLVVALVAAGVYRWFFRSRHHTKDH